MNILNNEKYQAISPQEMNAINAGKKQWVATNDVTWTQVDCPESAQREHPGVNCYTSERVWNYVNGRGKVLGTETRPD